MSAQALFLVFIGAGIGGVLRYLMGLGTATLVGVGFPWGTFAVNAIGCLVMGIFARTIPPGEEGVHSLRLLLMTGVLGGFTTYSAFALDAATLWMRDDIGAAMLYTAGTVITCLAGIALGLWVGRWIIA